MIWVRVNSQSHGVSPPIRLGRQAVRNRALDRTGNVGDDLMSDDGGRLDLGLKLNQKNISSLELGCIVSYLVDIADVF